MHPLAVGSDLDLTGQHPGVIVLEVDPVDTVDRDDVAASWTDKPCHPLNLLAEHADMAALATT